MRLNNKHPDFPDHFIRQAVRWIAKQLEVPRLRELTIITGHRPRKPTGYYGWYRHRPISGSLVEAYTGRDNTFPIGLGHTRSEEHHIANNEAELLVYLLAHELEHARVYQVTSNVEKRKRLNDEVRVRAAGFRVMLAFRADADRLMEQWLTVPVTTRRSSRSRSTDVTSAEQVAATREVAR